jgi:hypothetical protein
LRSEPLRLVRSQQNPIGEFRQILGRQLSRLVALRKYRLNARLKLRVIVRVLYEQPPTWATVGIPLAFTSALSQSKLSESIC